MVKRMKWPLAAVCTAAVALTGCGGSGGSRGGGGGGGGAKDTITLGTIQSTTGGSALYGRAVVRGNKLAIAELNDSGGLLGKQIKLLEEDNAGDNAQTVNLVRKLAQEGIDALISPTYQPNNDAACAVSTSLGLPQIASLSPPPPEKVNRQQFCYMATADLDGHVTNTIDFIARQYRVTKFAQVYDQQNAYQSTFNRVGTEHINSSGLDLVADLGVDTGANDYGPQITRLIQSGAEVVMPNLVTDDAARFMRQARDRGLRALFVGPNASLLSERLYDLSGGAADGLIVSTTQSVAVPSYKRFLRAFADRIGKLEDPLSGYAYDSVLILGEAIENARSTDADAIRTAILRIDRFCGSICYRSDGNGNFYSDSLYFQRLDKDGWTPVGDKVELGVVRG